MVEEREVLELVEVTDEQFDSLGKLRGTVFKDFLRMSASDSKEDMDEADLEVPAFLRKKAD